MKNIILFITLSLPLFAVEKTAIWNRNPEPDVVSYTLYYRRGVDPIKEITTDKTSVTLDLEPGEWNFSVKATNDEGTDSILSEPVKYIIKKNAPSQPKALKITGNNIPEIRIEGSADKKKWFPLATIVNYKKLEFVRIN